MRAFTNGLLASLSIGVGYFPIAFSFGLAAIQAGLSSTTAILISVTVFAGASQFILITLLVSGAGILSAIVTVLLMNARHLFYGPPLLGLLPKQQTGIPTALLAFGLTDEVFAAAMSKLDGVPAEQREKWYLGLQLGAYTAWTTGTILGVALGSGFGDMPTFVREALAFILPALFFALLLEMKVSRWVGTIAVAASVTAILLRFLPNYHALALGMLAGASFKAIGVRQ
ncbi:MAG: AzlC family ABC transporter permease [Burkholderiaceae bacterium]